MEDGQYKIIIGAIIIVFIMVLISGAYIISEEKKETERVVQTLEYAIEQRGSNIQSMNEIIEALEEKSNSKSS